MSQQPTRNRQGRRHPQWILDEPFDLQPRRHALRIALIYLFLGVFWILVSDELLEWMFPVEYYPMGQTYKGWFYVFATAVLLYGLVSHRMQMTADAATTARDAYSELQQHYEELAAAEEELLYQKEFINGLVEDAPGIIMIWDLDGEIREVNPYGRKVLADSTGRLPAVEHIMGLRLSQLQEGLQGKRFLRCENDNLHVNNQQRVSILWQSRLLQSGLGPDHADVISIGTDITEKRALEEQLEFLAYRDELTELPNRQHLQKQMDSWLDNDVDFALVVIDLDHFQDINDALGHGAGDAFLQHTAKQLQTVLQSGDYLARIGGDEFGFLWPGISSADDVRGRLETVFSLFGTWSRSGHEFAMNFSAGAALFPQHGCTTEELLRAADTALNNAKKLGRGRCSVYSQDVQERNIRAIQISSGIRRALENNEFELFFQPQIHVSKDQVVGAEALIRWPQGGGNWLPPVSFIPLAEDTGQIFEIDLWVMAQALEEKKYLESQGSNQSLSVNISSRTLNQPQSLLQLTKSIREAAVDTSGMVVEVTETALLDNVQAAAAALTKLKDLGLRIALDDFGTGYSSLEFLSKWPIDIIKLDRSFVANIGMNQKNEAIIRIVLELAKELQYQVVAEGVETPEQWEFLRAGGCNLAQGYWFFKPMEKAAFHSLLQTNHSSGHNGRP